MKTKIILIIGIILLILAGIGIYILLDNQDSKTANNISKDEKNNAEDNDKSSTSNKKARISFTFEDGDVVYGILEDNPSTKSLLSMLPMTIQFEDYAKEEKIAYPKEEISKEGAKKGYNPVPGDILIYAPWGNISIFYKEHGYSDELIYLGKMEQKDLQKFISKEEPIEVEINIVK